MISLPGGWELILIAAIIVVLFGGTKALSSLGRGIYSVKKEVDDIKDDLTSNVIKNVTNIDNIDKKDKKDK